MSLRLAFFATPAELDRAFDDLRPSMPFDVWKLREGSGLEVGPLRLAGQPTQPGEVTYLGSPPKSVLEASIRRAILDWGFIMCVRPMKDDDAKVLWLGELMSTTEAAPRGNPLFVALAKRMRQVLKHRTIVYRLDGRPGEGRGPRCTGEAARLFEDGYDLSQYGVARMGYAPEGAQRQGARVTLPDAD